jgi:hypothetical protein
MSANGTLSPLRLVGAHVREQCYICLLASPPACLLMTLNCPSLGCAYCAAALGNGLYRGPLLFCFSDPC